ncbi:MAG: acyltransferase family protein [Opitutaceae bacterium]|jgi:peptidoglycan/LPS O-acetylase OafA/YrhL
MAGFLSLRLAPPGPGRDPEGRDLALEGLRGLCALTVFYGHAIAPIPCLDPGYSPPAPLWWFDMASVSVLVFFVLSGYVIGLTVRAPFAAPAVRGYLARRLLRLAPVNTAAVLISWALAPRTAFGTVLGNLGIMENYNPYLFGWRVPVMLNNAALWTLNFELLYYLMFLAVWRLAPRAGWLLCGLAALTVAAVGLPGFPEFVSCYACGALYWVAGLSIAWLAPRDAGRGNWPSALLVAAVMWPLAPFWAFSGSMHFADLSVPPVSVRRLDILPVCVWLILAVTGRARRWQGRLAAVSLSVASAGVVVRFASGAFGDMGRGPFVAYAAAVALAWALAGWRPEPSALARIAPLGLVSFGLYAVSLALQYGVLAQPLLPRGTAWSYCLRFALLTLLAFGTAWLLERRLQPALRRRFIGPRPSGAPPQRA